MKQFLTVLERDHPGADEYVVAIVYIQDGQTIWLDTEGEHPYAVIPPNEDAFEGLQSAVSQGDRRSVVVPAKHFGEVKNALRRRAEK